MVVKFELFHTQLPTVFKKKNSTAFCASFDSGILFSLDGQILKDQYGTHTQHSS
jgi:hypothetical protein